MHRNFLIHVGFSKTATTTLQKHLFAKNSQLEYLGKPFQSDSLKTQIDRLLRQETTTFDSSSAKQEISMFLLNPRDSMKKWLVLSEEKFVSCSKVRDKGVIARRIKDVLNPSRILFTIRNQFDILKDAYLSGGRLLPNAPQMYSSLFVEFDDWLSNSYQNYDRSYIGHVDYYKTISYYSELFGKKNVCILLFEEFVQNQEVFIRKLTDFLGIDFTEALKAVENKHENQGIGLAQLDMERAMAKLYPLIKIPALRKFIKFSFRQLYKHRKKSSAQLKFSVQWNDVLSDFYKAGNMNLMNHYNLPLELYNYPL